MVKVAIESSGTGPRRDGNASGLRPKLSVIGTPSMVKRLKRGFCPAKLTARVELVSSVAKGSRRIRSRMSRLTEATLLIWSALSRVAGPSASVRAPFTRDAVTTISWPCVSSANGSSNACSTLIETSVTCTPE